MAISELRDIRKRTREYIDKHVDLEIEVLPEQPEKINVDDTFKIKLKVKNSPSDPTKRIRLKNIIYRLRSPNSTLALLRVPTQFDGWKVIFGGIPGQHVEEMGIQAVDHKDNILGVFGESAILKPPPIPLNPAISKGSPTIFVRIISAELDSDFLFPTIESGEVFTKFTIKE